MADLTRQDAEREVARCLGDYAVEHDVPAIADACHELVGVWNVALVDAEDFWRLVRLHALDDAGREVSAPRDGDLVRRSRVETSSQPSAPRDGDLVVGQRPTDKNSRSAPRDGDGPR